MSLLAIHDAFTRACKDHETHLLESAPGAVMAEYAPILAHSTISALFWLLANSPATPKLDEATKAGLLRALLGTLRLGPEVVEAIMLLDTLSPEFRQYLQGLDAPLQ